MLFTWVLLLRVSTPQNSLEPLTSTPRSGVIILRSKHFLALREPPRHHYVYRGSATVYAYFSGITSFFLYPIEGFPECLAGSLGDRSRPHTPAVGADCRQILPNERFLSSEILVMRLQIFFETPV